MSCDSAAFTRRASSIGWLHRTLTIAEQKNRIIQTWRHRLKKIS